MEMDWLKILQERGAILKGHFLLTSGLHSDTYFEKFRILEDPELTFKMLSELRDWCAGFRPDLILGPTTGGVLVAFALAKLLGVKAAYAERNNEGKRVIRRGFNLSGARVLIADDVLTTGKSLRETAEAARKAGAQVLAACVLIQRGEVDLGFPLRSVVKVEAKAWEPRECPLCREGVPLQVPGKGKG